MELTDDELGIKLVWDGGRTIAAYTLDNKPFRLYTMPQRRTGWITDEDAEKFMATLLKMIKEGYV